jgi:sugar lactone lactonase YvrE
MLVRRSLLVISVVAAATAPSVTATPAVPGSATIRIVADHVDNPRGLFIDAHGTLWAAAAGRGGRTCSRTEGLVCYGRTGRVLRIAGGHVHTFASGLASIHDGLGITGADDVAVAPNGSVFTAMITDDLELPAGANRRRLGNQLGKLLRFDTRGHPHVQANLLSVTHALDVGHPYGVLALPGRELVTDSEFNRVLEVRGHRARVLQKFPHGVNGADSVPTSLAVGPDGAVYVGELSGFAAGVDHARIWRMLPGQRAAVFATGFSAITGTAFGPDGSLYVCEFSRDFADDDLHGDVVRLAPDGTRTRYGLGQLFHPGGIAVAHDGTIYVSNWSTLAGQHRGPHHGQIVALVPR